MGYRKVIQLSLTFGGLLFVWEFKKLKFEQMMNKEKLLKIFEKYKNESTGGIYMTKWDSMADDILSSQNSSKPLVMCSLPLTEGAMKTNVKKSVMGLMSEPPPPTKPSKDVSGGNDA